MPLRPACREAGADLVTVAALMGHASIATTRIYTQPGEADMIRAVDKLRAWQLSPPIMHGVIG